MDPDSSFDIGTDDSASPPQALPPGTTPAPTARSSTSDPYYDPSMESEKIPLPPGGISSPALRASVMSIDMLRHHDTDPNTTTPDTGRLSHHPDANNKTPPENSSTFDMGEGEPDANAPRPEKPPEGFLSNEPGESGLSKILKNVGTAAVKVPGALLGMPGDIAHALMLAGAYGKHVFTDEDTGKIYGRMADRYAKLQDPSDPAYNPLIPPTSDDINKLVTHLTGEYQPESPLGRYAQTGMTAAGTMLAPGAWMNAAKEALLTRALKAATRASAVGTGAGTGQAIAEKTKNPLLGLLPAFAIPGMTELGIAGIDRYAKPLTQAGQRQIAAEKTFATSTPKVLTGKPPDGLPDTQYSAAGYTGDPGTARAEAEALKMNDKYRGWYDENIRQQNAENEVQRLRQLASPTADPKVAAKTINDDIDQLTAAHEENVARLQARTAANVPEATDVAPMGERGREILGAKRAEEVKPFSDMYNEIANNKGVNIVHTPISDWAKEQMANFNPRVDQPNAATPWLQRAAQWEGRAMPYADMFRFGKNVNEAIREAQRTGAQGLDQLMQLKGRLRQARDQAVENQVRFEQAQVAAGKMQQQDTLAANYARVRDEWLANRHAREGTGSGTDRNEPGPPGGVSSVSGGQGQGRGQQAGSPGGERVQSYEGLEPNISAPDAVKIDQANAGYRDVKQRFDNGPVGKVLAEDARGPKLNDARVAQLLFKKGDEGGVNLKAVLEADHSPATLRNVRDIALQRLRGAMKGDVLSPQDIAKWQKDYGPALQALEEHMPGFSKRFDNVVSATREVQDAMANQREAVKTATEGKAAKLAGLESADSIRDHVGGMMSAKDSFEQIDKLMSRVEHDPEGLDGIRRSATDWLEKKFQLAIPIEGSDQPMHMLNGRAMRQYIDSHRDTLRRLFGEDGVRYFEQYANGQERVQQVIANYRPTVGSDTATHVAPLLKQLAEEASKSAERGNIAHGATTVGLMELFMHGLNLKTGGLLLMAKGLGAFDKMMGGARNAGYRNAGELFLDGLRDPALRQQLYREGQALDVNGRSAAAMRAYSYLVGAGQAMGGAGSDENEKRQGRARGGAVDHKANGARMVEMAHKLRRELGKETKPLLHAHDNVIATALQVAKEAHG